MNLLISMRKMKKINGYLVVKFNARELREYEGTALGEYGVIDAELYTGNLDVDRGAMEYDNAGSMEEAVELALKSGKITPAQRGWAKGYALKSPDGFKEFLEKAPQAVPMSEIAGGDALALKGNKPDEATMLVCKQLGVSAEDVQKYGMKEE